jgi:hypothetical protein
MFGIAFIMSQPQALQGQVAMWHPVLVLPKSPALQKCVSLKLISKRETANGTTSYFMPVGINHNIYSFIHTAPGEPWVISLRHSHYREHHPPEL